jgi:hypothetical protein
MANRRGGARCEIWTEMSKHLPPMGWASGIGPEPDSRNQARLPLLIPDIAVEGVGSAGLGVNTASGPGLIPAVEPGHSRLAE